MRPIASVRPPPFATTGRSGTQHMRPLGSRKRAVPCDARADEKSSAVRTDGRAPKGGRSLLASVKLTIVGKEACKSTDDVVREAAITGCSLLRADEPENGARLAVKICNPAKYRRAAGG